MSALLRRASLRIVNQSSIPTLIRRVQKGAESPAHLQSALNAQTWLTWISKSHSTMYQQHIGELTKAIADEKNTRLVEVCLQALAAAARSDNKLTPSDKCVTCRSIFFTLIACLMACSLSGEQRIG